MCDIKVITWLRGGTVAVVRVMEFTIVKGGGLAPGGKPKTIESTVLKYIPRYVYNYNGK